MPKVKKKTPIKKAAAIPMPQHTPPPVQVEKKPDKINTALQQALVGLPDDATAYYWEVKKRTDNGGLAVVGEIPANIKNYKEHISNVDWGGPGNYALLLFDYDKRRIEKVPTIHIEVPPAIVGGSNEPEHGYTQSSQSSQPLPPPNMNASMMYMPVEEDDDDDEEEKPKKTPMEEFMENYTKNQQNMAQFLQMNRLQKMMERDMGNMGEEEEKKKDDREPEHVSTIKTMMDGWNRQQTEALNRLAEMQKSDETRQMIRAMNMSQQKAAQQSQNQIVAMMNAMGNTQQATMNMIVSTISEQMKAQMASQQNMIQLMQKDPPPPPPPGPSIKDILESPILSKFIDKLTEKPENPFAL